MSFKSAEGVRKTITVIVNDFQAAGAKVSENMMETMLIWAPNRTSLTSPLVKNVAGRGCRQTLQSLLIAGIINETTDSIP